MPDSRCLDGTHTLARSMRSGLPTASLMRRFLRTNPRLCTLAVRQAR